MKCQACGTEVQPNTVYCHQCGERVVDDETSLAEEGVAEQPNDPSPAEAFRAGRQSAGGKDDDHEFDIWSGGYSPKAMYGVWIGCGVATIALIVAGFLLAAAAPWIWFVALPAILLLWGYPAALLIVRRLSVRYRLTSHRFFHERGILKRVTDRIEVIDIDDITFEQGVLERVFGVGTIRVVSSDRTHPELLMAGIEDVKTVAQQMDDARRTERRRRGLHIEAI